MALEYFTLPEFRALPQMGDAAKYSDARVESAAAGLVAAAEHFAGVSFLPRSQTETKSGTDANMRGGGLVLTQRRPIAVTALTQGGVALTVPELAQVQVNGGVARWYVSGVAQSWEAGSHNIAVTYTAGFSAVPADVKEAIMQATRARLLATASNSAVDDRRTSMNTELGTINFVIAGKERPTGYPEVDEVLLRYRRARAPMVF